MSLCGLNEGKSKRHSILASKSANHLILQMLVLSMRRLLVYVLYALNSTNQLGPLVEPR